MFSIKYYNYHGYDSEIKGFDIYFLPWVVLKAVCLYPGTFFSIFHFFLCHEIECTGTVMGNKHNGKQQLR